MCLRFQHSICYLCPNSYSTNLLSWLFIIYHICQTAILPTYFMVFEVIIIEKSDRKRIFKDGVYVNSNEKEGTTNDIALTLDLINVTNSHNFYVGVAKPRLSVLGCL